LILGANVYYLHDKNKTPVLTASPTFDGKRTIPNQAVTDLIIEMLALTPEDKLLEIGTGSGYQTQEFAKSGAEIHSIELEPFVTASGLTVGHTLVYLHSGDGKYGLEHEAPFTAIVATCGVPEVRKEWIDQLAEQGRMVLPLGDSSVQKLTLLRKIHGEIVPERVGAYVRFQMLRS
jgi:protein-L-isoaspartate(D-aspartate) O-methyltransferase